MASGARKKARDSLFNQTQQEAKDGKAGAEAAIVYTRKLQSEAAVVLLVFPCWSIVKVRTGRVCIARSQVRTRRLLNRCLDILCFKGTGCDRLGGFLC